MINGQVNLYDAVRGTISFEGSGKHYALRKDQPVATLLVRYFSYSKQLTL